MIELVDKTFEDTADGEYRIDVIIDSCKKILEDYILLILNERNYRDAKVIQHIESSQVMFPDHEEVKTSFCLLTLMEYAETTDEVIDYIKDNSIIIKNDKEVINEFFDIMRVRDELMDDYSPRYLTRRILLSDLKAKVTRQSLIAQEERRLSQDSK